MCVFVCGWSTPSNHICYVYIYNKVLCAHACAQFVNFVLSGYFSTKGSEFHFFFLSHNGDIQILVTTNESEPVTFWVFWEKRTSPRTKSNTTHTVSRGKIVLIDIPQGLSIRSVPAHDIGIQLQSQDEKRLTVVGFKESYLNAMEAFLVFPKIETKSKTYKYFALSYDKQGSIKTFFRFVTTDRSTKITITPVTRIDISFETFVVGLDSGRNYTETVPAAGTLVAGTASGDISGTRIISDKPLSFFTGFQCDLNPSDCSRLVEQVPPTETWGFNFFLVPLSRQPVDVYRILASRGGTECSVTCTDASRSETITLANPGDFKELIYTTRYCNVECNHPVLIFQFRGGPDPFAVMIPPVGQYSNDYDLVFIEKKLFNNLYEAWINIAIPAEYDPSGLRFHGSPLCGVRFVDVNCSDGEVCGRVAQYKAAYDSGSYKLEHIDPDARFMAIVYGWARRYGFVRGTSYGYVGGMKFDSIAGEFGNLLLLLYNI